MVSGFVVEQADGALSVLVEASSVHDTGQVAQSQAHGPLAALATLLRLQFRRNDRLAFVAPANDIRPVRTTDTVENDEYS